MSDSDNHRNPFTDDEGDQDTIARLVAGAAQTHREPQKESTRKRPRYPSEVERTNRRISLDLEPELKEALKDLAQEIASSRKLSAVSQALIEYGLEAYRLGRIEIRPCVRHGAVSFEAVDVESNEK